MLAAPSPLGVDTSVAIPRAHAAPAYGYSAPQADLPAVSALMSSAIAARHLPGAVVMVGHDGQVALLRAYGVRKPAGEPGVDGFATPAEPMTEDTVFDVASLTKVLATATAVMQLYEQGKVRLDDPVQTYLPAFNPAHDPHRAAVTVRTLLTHTSGLPGDVNLDDPWGLAHTDRAEGMRRALSAPLEMPPGAVFRYSDINFELLGALVEAVTGEPEDVYARRNVFVPLGMTETRYLPSTGPVARNHTLLSRVAPTRLDTEGRPSTNPHFGSVMRGVVDDPTSRRMGGVAGHAGVFSTAADVGRFAQALLDRLAGRPSAFPLRRSTLQTMTAPNRPSAPGAVRGVRGLGWDIDTGYSGSRGTVFSVGSFGHTGFTGTSLWIDPGSDSYVVVLSNAVHTPGSPPISRLAGAVATAAARALGVAHPG
ncbi:beta-lactamase family protein [Mycobacterium sp. PSTR-4-N]|uniref:serine hydrolase domain-containing protein n=1 Tax=Mycobacterium sp. PSTR-4-N TaxID=2917745 RepID=UPI001F14F0EB|nr:beta-lactamase family protein [Mycobacterium sp. PSTR-4-N]MCG7592612.1 beta-lactamase family protein [Mycobacterium sp. PSTR-4-N]